MLVINIIPVAIKQAINPKATSSIPTIVHILLYILNIDSIIKYIITITGKNNINPFLSSIIKSKLNLIINANI